MGRRILRIFGVLLAAYALFESIVVSTNAIHRGEVE